MPADPPISLPALGLLISPLLVLWAWWLAGVFRRIAQSVLDAMSESLGRTGGMG